jgi:hypothetical protein
MDDQGFQPYNTNYSMQTIRPCIEKFNKSDYELIKRLASFGLTKEQICIAIKIDKNSFANLYKTDEKFKNAFDEGKTDLHMSILAAQLQMALPDPENGYIGNASMLKHIGNVHLGQSDKIEIKEEKNINVVLKWGNTKIPEESKEENNNE